MPTKLAVKADSWWAGKDSAHPTIAKMRTAGKPLSPIDTLSLTLHTLASCLASRICPLILGHARFGRLGEKKQRKKLVRPVKDLVERFIRSPEVGELAAQMVRVVYQANKENLLWKAGKEPDIEKLLERFREVTGLNLSDDELYDLARKIYFEKIRRAR